MDDGFHGIKAVAELKHDGHGGDARGPGHGFHGIKAVAELKPADVACSSSRQVNRFHGIKAVAELKLGVDRDTDEGSTGSFHGIKAVAELKRLRPDAPAWCGCRFPRHQSRGRIEAMRTCRAPPEARVSTASKPWPN